MICVHIHGGLGNRIFQLAAALGLSKKMGKNIILQKKILEGGTYHQNDSNKAINNIRKIFPFIEILDNFNDIDFYLFKEECKYSFEYKEFNIDKNNILLDGYFINEKYFPINFHEMINLKPNKNINIDFENLYFIHIRLGDVIENQNFYNIYYFNLSEYYKFAINKIKTLNNKARFIVCTNSFDKYLDTYILNFTDCEYILQDKDDDDLDTLYIMSKCQGGICSNSTFSWLGAYFQKIKNKDFIFMPFPWVRYNDVFNYENTKDVYPLWTTMYNTIENKIMLNPKIINIENSIFISVVIPVYNGIEFIEESVESVINQTYTNWELIIGINDNFKETEIFKLLKKYEEKNVKIKVFQILGDKGKSDTLNNIINLCNYDYIAILESYNKWELNKLEIQVPYLNTYDVVGSKCIYFGDLNNIIPEIPEGDISNFDFLTVNPIINSSAIIKKDLCYWYKEYECIEDYELWLRLIFENKKFYNCKEILVNYRYNKNSLDTTLQVNDLRKKYIKNLYF